jgi:hypothetical protein
VPKGELELSDIEVPFIDDGAKAHLLDMERPLTAREESDAELIRSLVLLRVSVRDMLECANDLSRLLDVSRSAAAAAARTTAVDLDATNITAADMNDDELDTYVRRTAEVDDNVRKRAKLVE